MFDTYTEVETAPNLPEVETEARRSIVNEATNNLPDVGNEARRSTVNEVAPRRRGKQQVRKKKKSAHTRTQGAAESTEIKHLIPSMRTELVVVLRAVMMMSGNTRIGIHILTVKGIRGNPVFS